MTFRIAPAALATCLIVSAAAPATAQGDGQLLGLVEYRNSCATCHGASAQGDGPLAAELQRRPPDLTRLQAENGGIFPLSYAYEVIAHSFEVDAHGSTDMPAWGQRYSDQASAVLGDNAPEAERQELATFRILALLEYLMSVQAE